MDPRFIAKIKNPVIKKNNNDLLSKQFRELEKKVENIKDYDDDLSLIKEDVKELKNQVENLVDIIESLLIINKNN